MTAAIKNLEIEQGATFFLGFTWCRPGPEVDGVITPGDPYDLTGCSARMQIRPKRTEPVIVAATSATDDSPGAGRIVLGGLTGRIEITLTDEDTDLLTSTKGVYDLEVEWPIQTGELRPRVDRVLQGAVAVDLNVTRAVT